MTFAPKSFFPAYSSRKNRHVIHGGSKDCFDTPCLRRFEVPDLFPHTQFSSSPKRWIFDFTFNMVQSRRGVPISAKPLFSRYPRSEILKRPSGHSNQISNYLEFQTSNPFAPIFIGFPFPCSKNLGIEKR
ncbi:hypothetical protein AVEN_84904-1 [Araneus ventricosus]|uniref:Uncharacterized protein n=1 Tax=Araneus ventricosus TaxID=182803 RepID=A0A4Y2TAP2_ARAVE|nr:hypothetical protein AVEN_272825-1 [Araneus ventricosus]GBN96546.1 hypothetical protein AVEN_84904-1 [Araneus ventricosus]